MTIDTTYDDGDIDTNASDNPHLNDLISVRYSRRQTMMGGMSAATAAVFGGMLLTGCDDDNDNGGASPVTVTATAGGSSSAGRVATLTGAAIGQVDSVTWTQTAGPPVTLAGANTSVATFIVPGAAAGTALTFQFTAVTARESASATTTVTVGAASLGFTAVPKSLADVVAAPTGYTVNVLYRLGDPIAAGVPAYANNGTDTNFAQRAGDHHDGMSYFGLAAGGNAPDPTNSARGLLVMNHENISEQYLHANGVTAGPNRLESEAIKEIECHGVSVVEVSRAASGWSYNQTSALNRRITPNTPMTFNGPVRGNPILRTRQSPDGTAGRGTINNCANGTMPWHTYLTNEENWAGYFRRNAGDVAARAAATGNARQNVSLARYGIGEGRAGNYNWTTVIPADATSTIFSRWNATIVAGTPADGSGDFRNEPFQLGWVVEIDPFDPASTPRKRTALGRMNHEGCEIGRIVPGVKPAFYMGDDAQNEYLYKFVSNTPWSAADANRLDRLAVGDKYLDAGILYVARLNADGSGQWLPLVYDQGPLTGANAAYAFASQADVLVNARLAGDALGATKMDRPEWTAVNPATGEMYLTLTNNASRRATNVDAPNPRAYTDPKVDGRAPSTGNVNGHVIRLREAGDTSEALAFTWDIYAFGAGSDLDPVNINLSGLDATNDFSSPDGLWFGLPSNASGTITPVMWIETDDGSYTDVTNCMLLAAIPGKVGDGTTRDVTSSFGGTATVTTRIGKAPGATLRRFLVGPVQCEITGIYSTPDGRSLFVNIQHPGEGGNPTSISSSWPANQSGAVTVPSRPRSSTIVITKNDGGVVGL